MTATLPLSHGFDPARLARIERRVRILEDHLYATAEGAPPAARQSRELRTVEADAARCAGAAAVAATRRIAYPLDRKEDEEGLAVGRRHLDALAEAAAPAPGAAAVTAQLAAAHQHRGDAFYVVVMRLIGT